MASTSECAVPPSRCPPLAVRRDAALPHCGADARHDAVLGAARVVVSGLSVLVGGRHLQQLVPGAVPSRRRQPGGARRRQEARLRQHGAGE